jgi:hypothetical protein
LAASDGQAVGRCVVAFDERVHCTMFGRPPHSTRLLSGTAAVRLLSGPRLAWDDPSMSGDVVPDVSALAINVTIPEGLRWTDTRRGEEFTLTTLNVRLLPDGRLAAKAYGRPTGGGRGAYIPFPVPNRPELAALVAQAASRAGALWAAHLGLS